MKFLPPIVGDIIRNTSKIQSKSFTVSSCFKMAKSITFTNGFKMPIVGLGTWQTTDEKQLEAALDAALEAGYRHIDTAYMYGNEALIGRVLKKWFDSGKISREELFIVTKLPPIGSTPEKVPHFLRLSLASLQLTYVDLYLIHVPFGLQYVDDKTLLPMKDGATLWDMNTNLEAIWKAMEVEADAGRARSLGVSNFSADQVRRIVNIARHKPMNNQVELHAYFQQKPLRDECKKLGVTVTAYGPVGSPGRKVLYEARGVKFESNGLLDDPTVKRIAESKGKTPAQVLLRFLTLEDIIVIPKSANPERVLQNVQIFDIELSTEELNELRNLDKGEEGRSFTFESFHGVENHPEYTFEKTKRCPDCCT